jgi:hypothetical protein
MEAFGSRLAFPRPMAICGCPRHYGCATFCFSGGAGSALQLTLRAAPLDALK